ncbi:P1 family peptidase [Sulfitobacter guttiformis]|uniref:D-aminopeptidase n=1 Tax=Sulfitobacter guttiformis TaxID=74349 RepID=A0A420DRH0_9RHOB|nr:P1 family peptidase [Sulfitobacter guttiformis]KIN74174.1 Peptidase, T4 family protein [Sulfitobacter guttiformis KCTC 32187]RKE96788.1 D-aminopeptidase [Sulfitobacter guttiformis]
MKPGPTNSMSDVGGLRVGNAQDTSLKSGTTVVVGDAPFVTSVAVMGGAPGTRETDLLAPDKSVAAVDALVLSGGSAYGLDACSGVMDGLRSDGRGFRVGPAQIPLVPGAILFDLLNGGDKGWSDNPYRALGLMAYKNATEAFEIGSVGAGTGALTAMLKGGLGTASLVLPDGSTVAALVAANPVGAVTTPGDRHFYAAPFEMAGEFGGLGPDPASGLGLSRESRKMAALSPRTNTTIAIVATNAALTKAECHRIATAAHDGIARACVPAHTPNDGDLVFALTTGALPAADVLLTGHAAALCLSRAIARAVYAATPADTDIMPCWRTANADV